MTVRAESDSEGYRINQQNKDLKSGEVGSGWMQEELEELVGVDMVKIPCITVSNSQRTNTSIF